MSQDATPILHMLTPQKHMSPFDVNMAADAGYKVIVPYINTGLDEVTGLVQDAIFSRPPNYGVKTGFFMGGKDAILALDMMEAALQGDGAAVPMLGFRGPRRLVHDCRRHGRLRRARAEE